MVRNLHFTIKSLTKISTLSLDVSGIVEAVGSNVTIFKKGDRVFGFADGFSSGKLENSAFQTYTNVTVTSAAKLPDNIDFEHGAMLPMAVATASIALFNDLELPRPSLDLTQERSETILIWGGASALGSMAIQLARLAGLVVYAVASPSHHAYLKSLGASELFDYRSPNIVNEVVDFAQSAGRSIGYAMDVISEEKTLTTVGKILSALGNKTSKLAHVLPWPEHVAAPPDVQLLSVSGETVWTTRKDFSEWLFHTFLPSALERKLIVPSPQLRIVEGGLDGLQSAMDSLKSGVSGQKLVVKPL